MVGRGLHGNLPKIRNKERMWRLLERSKGRACPSGAISLQLTLIEKTLAPWAQPPEEKTLPEVRAKPQNQVGAWIVIAGQIFEQKLL